MSASDPLSNLTGDQDEADNMFSTEDDSGNSSVPKISVAVSSTSEGENPHSYNIDEIESTKPTSSTFQTHSDVDTHNKEGSLNESECNKETTTNGDADFESDLLAQIEEEMNSGPKDLDVTVENPEKIVKTMESYVAFTVKTKINMILQTTRSEFEDAEYSVKRRYNDFLWLRVQLDEQYPHLVIPPLPEKHSLTIDRFDKEFIRFREVALDRFMQKVAQHPITSQDSLLKAFITLQANDFQAFKKKGAGLLSRMTKSISNMGGSFMLKQRSEEYTKMYEYCTGLGERMAACERITSRLIGEQNDYLTWCGSSIALYQNWQAAERRQLATNLGLISELMDTCHSSYKTMVDDSTLKLALPFKEYSMYADAVKSSLTKRDALQHELEVLAEELVRSNDELQQLESGQTGGGFLGRNSTEEAVQLKKDKVKVKISELDEAHCKCKKSLEERNKQLSLEIERWHVNKRLDMKETVGGMAERNITVYDQQISALEETLHKLKECLV